MSQTSPVTTFRSSPAVLQGLLVAGVLVFIASFFPVYGVSVPGATVDGVKIGGISASITAWHSYATLGLLLSFAATIIAAVVLFARHVVPQNMPVGVSWIVAGLAALGFLLVLLRLVTWPSGSGVGIRWGGWVLMIVMIAQTACAVIAALSSGEPAPWAGRTASPGAPTDTTPTEPPPAPPAV